MSPMRHTCACSARNTRGAYTFPSIATRHNRVSQPPLMRPSVMNNAGLMRALVVIGLVLGALLRGVPAFAQSAPYCAPGQLPGFVFGFAALHDWLGDATMGAAATCEYADPNGTGDTQQNTTRGLAFWRKSTNTPTFTDGDQRQPQHVHPARRHRREEVGDAQPPPLPLPGEGKAQQLF